MSDDPHAPARLYRIFVYGTLRRGGANHHYLHGQSRLGAARSGPGYRMYQLDGYPGLVAAPDAPGGILGEVWAVTGSCLRRLDVLEGLREGLYNRGPVRLEPPFDTDEVLTYFYARDVSGRPDAGRDWLAR
jgi:gamma-glutamylaminecyclotransferase